MAIVTLEVPEELLGDIYIAVGTVLRDGAREEEAAEERRRAARGTQQSQDDDGAEA